MKIVITGGAGFIGSNTVDKLIGLGHKVVIIDNLVTGRKENINHDAVFYHTDIRDDSIKDIFLKEKPEVVIHDAAQISVRISVEDPRQDADINICGSLNIIEAARASQAKKIIFASSGGTVYGEQEYFPADEKHSLNPVSPYGVAKLAVEKYLYYYWKNFGLEYIALRYGNIYGPRQDPLGEAGVVAIFSKQILDGRDPIVNGDGKQTRDYVYVGDVVEANIKALDNDFVGGLNIGTGIESDVLSLFKILKQISGTDVEKVHGPAKKGEQRRSVLSYNKARQVLGWEPTVSLKQGLEKTYNWFKQRKP
ncbi:MAG: NAD-dependent epimerase/dehydratase family protein [Actinomycetia bacterium]|nr:NAD-dependent epimerase/dehydratase family protein [Actinomycetes bacterium]